MRSNSKVSRRIMREEERREGGYSYKYTLSVCESVSVASYKLPLYSITVALTDAEGNTTCGDTREIFADLGKANSFFDKLVRNLATPINLAYVVEDEISV